MSSFASAAVLELDGTLANGKLSKDASSVYTGLSKLTGDYIINSLSFSFTFLDDKSDTWNTSPTVTNVTTGDYKPHPWSNWMYRDATVTNTTTRTSQQESATLWFGDLELGTDSTKMVSSQDETNYFPYLHYDGKNCEKVKGKKKCTYYKSVVTTTDLLISHDYTGGFTIFGTTSNSALIQQLLSHGALTLDLEVRGDLLLTASQVELNYTQVEAPADVPEPSSVLLAGLGLAALGVARRRRASAAA